MNLEKRFKDLILGRYRKTNRFWIASTFNLLRERYGERHRHYHNIGHIEQCLSVFDQVKDKIEDKVAVELAIFFHDLIYNPKAKDNEVKSAELTYELLKNLDVELAEKVKELVLFTEYSKTFFDSHNDSDFIYLRDIDFNTMGTDLYWENSEHIRNEFSHLTDFEFNSGRIVFLKMIKDKGEIFHSNSFKLLGYNEKAMLNINEEIKIISKSIGESS